MIRGVLAPGGSFGYEKVPREREFPNHGDRVEASIADRPVVGVMTDAKPGCDEKSTHTFA